MRMERRGASRRAATSCPTSWRLDIEARVLALRGDEHRRPVLACFDVITAFKECCALLSDARARRRWIPRRLLAFCGEALRGVRSVFVWQRGVVVVLGGDGRCAPRQSAWRHEFCGGRRLPQGGLGRESPKRGGHLAGVLRRLCRRRRRVADVGLPRAGVCTGEGGERARATSPEKSVRLSRCATGHACCRNGAALQGQPHWAKCLGFCIGPGAGDEQWKAALRRGGSGVIGATFSAIIGLFSVVVPLPAHDPCFRVLFFCYTRSWSLIFPEWGRYPFSECMPFFPRLGQSRSKSVKFGRVLGPEFAELGE